jgi:hypothetical protein
MQILETEQIKERLRLRYYNDWLDGDTSIWPAIALKLEMIDELWETLRKIDNA